MKTTKIMLTVLMLTTGIASTFANEPKLISTENISNAIEINSILEQTEDVKQVTVDKETLDKELQNLFILFEKIYHE